MAPDAKLEGYCQRDAWSPGSWKATLHCQAREVGQVTLPHCPRPPASHLPLPCRSSCAWCLGGRAPCPTSLAWQCTGGGRTAFRPPGDRASLHRYPSSLALGAIAPPAPPQSPGLWGGEMVCIFWGIRMPTAAGSKGQNSAHPSPCLSLLSMDFIWKFQVVGLERAEAGLRNAIAIMHMSHLIFF